MENIRAIIWCFLVTCVLCACEDKEEETMQVTKLALTTDSVQLLSPEAQIINVKFECSEAWEVVDADSLDAWCAIYPPSGTADSRKVISVKVPKNDTFEERSVNIRIRSGEEQVITKIVQAPYHVMMQYDMVPGGSYANDKIGVNGDDWSWRIDLYSKSEWTIISKDEWIMIKGTDDSSTPEVENGTGDFTLHIYAKPNTTGTDREGYFTVKSKNTEAKVKVRQYGK